MSESSIKNHSYRSFSSSTSSRSYKGGGVICRKVNSNARLLPLYLQSTYIHIYMHTYLPDPRPFDARPFVSREILSGINNYPHRTRRRCSLNWEGRAARSVSLDFCFIRNSFYFQFGMYTYARSRGRVRMPEILWSPRVLYQYKKFQLVTPDS